MQDLIAVALVTALFILAVAYVHGTHRLKGRRP